VLELLEIERINGVGTKEVKYSTKILGQGTKDQALSVFVELGVL
jgi:hypothetical protein